MTKKTTTRKKKAEVLEVKVDTKDIQKEIDEVVAKLEEFENSTHVVDYDDNKIVVKINGELVTALKENHVLDLIDDRVKPLEAKLKANEEGLVFVGKGLDAIKDTNNMKLADLASSVNNIKEELDELDESIANNIYNLSLSLNNLIQWAKSRTFGKYKE